MNESHASTTDSLLAIIDRESIKELLYRYCRAVDRLDIPLGHSIWHEDAIADYGDIYHGPGKGVIDLICQQHLAMLHHSHQLANILITLDGDRAGSESYVHATLRMEIDGKLQQLDVWGRYIDEWSKRKGCWGLDKRVLIIDFDELRSAAQMQRHQRGRRDQADPSYKVLGLK